MAASNKSVIVAMVPYPAITHVNPLVLIARLITSYNISVHFICLPEFNLNCDSRLKGDQNFGIEKNIHYNDILLENYESKEDDDRGSSITELLKKHSEPIRRTCLQLSASAKKLVIIYDSIMKNNMGDVHSLPNVETYIFHTGSAFYLYSLLRQSIHDELDKDDYHEKLLEEMQDEFPTMDSCNPPGIDRFARDLHKWNLNSGEFMISSREFEGKYIDLLAHAKNKPLWALGPLYMLLQSHNNSSTISSSGDKAPRHECLEFLDNQDVNSVIYVSFGTTPKLSQEQVNELAFGLEKSNQRFIWVLGKGDHDYNTNNKKGVEKFEKKFGKIELPQGFEERVKGRGMVVRSWVPQLEILGHSSTGGFLSHCGWNSCIESISTGVPIITWPKEWDQPYNAVLVTNVLKIAIPLCSWTCKDELVTSASIEKSVKILMDTTEGEEMRKRAVELSNKIKRSVSPGGVTTKELESFISYITK